MNRVNLAQAQFNYPDTDPDGFVGGMVRPGPDFGATKTGVSSYELPPGQALCPYHYEWAEEEWLLVTEGRPTLRDPDGEHELQPMDLVFFPIGPEGAHKVQNDTAGHGALPDVLEPRLPGGDDLPGLGQDRHVDRPGQAPTATWPGARQNLDYYDGESVRKREAGPQGARFSGRRGTSSARGVCRCEQTSPGRPSPDVSG